MYKELYEVEVTVLMWYKTNIRLAINCTSNRKYLSTNPEQYCKESFNQLKSTYEHSYELNKYCVLPISIVPVQEKFLNLYCIPVIIYLSKYKIIHEGNYQIAHPLLQFTHNVSHADYSLQLENYKLLSSSEPIYMMNIFDYRRTFMKSCMAGSKHKYFYIILHIVIHETDIDDIIHVFDTNHVFVQGTTIQKRPKILLALEKIKNHQLKYYYYSKTQYDSLCEKFNIRTHFFINPIYWFNVFQLMITISQFEFRGQPYRKLLDSYYVNIRNINHSDLEFYENLEEICNSLNSSFNEVYGKDIPKLDISMMKNTVTNNNLSCLLK